MTKADWNIFADQPPPEPSARGWIKHEVLDGEVMHIMPSLDGMNHAFSLDCACKPEQTVTREDVFIIHKALDGRPQFGKDKL